ncbi:MAG TPA: LamG domain-containing protein, partial [Polyangia bacterium]
NPGEDCLPRANDGLKVCSPTTGSSGSGGAGGRSGGAGGTGRGGSGAGGSGQGGTTGGGTPGGGGGSAGSDGGRPDVTEVGGDVLRPDTPADVTVEVGPPADWPECPDNAKAVAQTEIDNGVVVYVPFEDESTSVMLDDWSVNPHRVLPKDLDLTTAQTSTARFGKAVDLAKGTGGLRGYVTVDSSAPINAIPAFTLAAWIKFPSGKPSDGIIISRRFRMFGLLYNLEIVNGNILRGQIFSGRQGNLAGMIAAPASRPIPQTTKWIHVAMTFQRSPDNSPQPGMSLYIDGTLVNEAPFPYALGQDLGPLVIGGGEDEAMNFANPPVTRRLGTLIDEVAVYGRALPASVVKALACGARPTKR